MKEGASQSLVDLWILVRIADDSLEYRINRKKELIAETLDALVVPCVGVSQFSFGSGLMIRS